MAWDATATRLTVLTLNDACVSSTSMETEKDPRFTAWHTLRGHGGPINQVVFSADGNLLASASDDRLVIIWAVDSGRRVQRLPARQAVTAVRWLPIAHRSRFKEPTGAALILGGTEGDVQIWERMHAQDEFRLIVHHHCFDSPIEDIAVSEGGSYVAVAGHSGHVLLYNLQLNNLDVPLRLHQAYNPPVDAPTRQNRRTRARNVLFFYANGLCLLASFLDAKDLVAWSVVSGQELWRYRCRTLVGDIAWSQSAGRLFVWNLSTGIDVYDVPIEETPRWRCLLPLSMRINQNRCMQIVTGWDGKLAVNGSGNGEIYVWDVERREILYVLRHGHESHAVQAIAYHHSQHSIHYLSSGSSSESDSSPVLRVWKLEPMKPRTQIKTAVVTFLAGLVAGAFLSGGLLYTRPL